MHFDTFMYIDAFL